MRLLLGKPSCNYMHLFVTDSAHDTFHDDRHAVAPAAVFQVSQLIVNVSLVLSRNDWVVGGCRGAAIDPMTACARFRKVEVGTIDVHIFCMSTGYRYGANEYKYKSNKMV